MTPWHKFLVVAIAAVGFVAGTFYGLAHTPATQFPDCPEDAALVWNGQTNAHTDCVTLDSIHEVGR